MWHLVPMILYLTHVRGHHHRPGNPYYVAERTKLEPHNYANPGPEPIHPSYNSFNFPVKKYLDYPAIVPSSNFQPSRTVQFTEDFYIPLLNKLSGQNPSVFYYLGANNLRQPQPSSKTNPFQDNYPLDVDYGNSDVNYPDADASSRNSADGQSYFDDLELVENFGNYLKRRTQLDSSSTKLNDAAHQYNALLAVIIALARVIRNSCADFNEVYDQVYQSTVDTNYKYGLHNADKVIVVIEDYIRKGNSHIPKLRKLKQEQCEKETYCSASVDNKIKNSALLYVKELETLDALAHLARSFFPYIEEFNQASQKGTVLQYLQNNKDRLKEYVMHVVNSVEHLSDKAVRCS